MNKPFDILVPRENVNDEFVVFYVQHFKSGDQVKNGDIIAELESSKATFEVTAEKEGYINYLFNEGDEIPVNDIFAQIFDEPVKIKKLPEKKDPQKIKQTSYFKVTDVQTKTIFSKKALDYIIVNNIDKRQFSDFNFVSMNEINLVTKNSNVKTESVPQNAQKISPFKKREIEYLSAVQGENLNSTLHIKVDTKNAAYFISEKLRFLKSGILPVVIYECARLLRKYPVLNSYFKNNNIVAYNDVNIGIAIDIEDKGLKIAAVKNADMLNLNETEDKIIELGDKYYDNQLSTDDIKDISFTITDLSNEGVTHFTPLISKNNAAILGISAIDRKNNECYLSLTFDHRVSEGKMTGIFLNELKQRIESYEDQQSHSLYLSKIRCSHCMKPLSEDISSVGFLKIINKEGEEVLICQTCFNGF